jgi:hypothetical protein
MGQDLGYLGGTVIKVIGLCQHFQKNLVMASSQPGSPLSQSRWELEGSMTTQACAIAL